MGRITGGILMKTKKIKKPSRKKVVKELDDAFQMYIRYRDNWTCICCGKEIKSFQEGAKSIMHAGHYIDRGNYKTRWDEINVNAQCKDCNGKEHWTKDKSTYALRMLDKYGREELDALENRKHGLSGFSTADLLEMTEKYKAKLLAYTMI